MYTKSSWPRLKKFLISEWTTGFSLKHDDTSIDSMLSYQNFMLQMTDIIIFGMSKIKICHINFAFQGLVQICFVWVHMSGGRFKKTYELLNLRALKISPVNKIHIFQCMGKIFCVEFQRVPLKFHTKYLTHTLKDTIFIQHWNFKSS